MELWIRSQSKRSLIQVKELEINGPEDWGQGFWSIDTYPNNTDLKDVHITLGKYENELRALEVLDEIQELVRGVEVAKTLNASKGNMDNVFPNIFYKMPEK